MMDTKKLLFLGNFIFNAYPYNVLKEAFFNTFIYSSKICTHFSLPFQNRIGNIKSLIFKWKRITAYFIRIFIPNLCLSYTGSLLK